MNGYQSLTDAFSNCSYENLQNDLRNGLNTCMFQTDMAYYNRSLTRDRCETEKWKLGSNATAVFPRSAMATALRPPLFLHCCKHL